MRVCDKMAEEQEDEIQALKAIYDADFAGMCILLIFSGESVLRRKRRAVGKAADFLSCFSLDLRLIETAHLHIYVISPVHDTV